MAAAVNQAMTKAREAAAKAIQAVTGGLNFPGMGLPGADAD